MKKISLSLLGCFMLASLFGYGQDTATTIKQFLLAGPQQVQLPAFHQQPNLNGKTFKAIDLLKFSQKEVKSPQAGEVFLKQEGREVKWTKVTPTQNLKTHFQTDYGLFYQVGYLQAQRFVKLTLIAESKVPFEVFLNNKQKTTQNLFSKKPVKKTVSLTLEPGKYTVFIKFLVKKGENATPVKISLKTEKAFSSNAVAWSLSPEQFMDIPHLLLGKRVTSASPSDDGSLVLLQYAETWPPQGKTEHWFEIHATQTGKVLFSSQHSNRRQAAWVPGKHAISYLTKNGPLSYLVCYNLDQHSEHMLMKTPPRFSGYRWSPKGSYLIYSVQEKYKPDKGGVFELRGMPDRWPWYRQRTQLYLFRPADKTSEPLTYGYLTNSLLDISQDESHILMAQSFPDYTKRLYTRQVLLQMNIKTKKVDTIWNTTFGGNAVYSPDGKKLLVTGSAAMFHGAGIHLKKAKIPNDFDIQGYIYTLATKKVEPITKNFNPSIESAWWNPADQQIYFRTTDKSYVDLWKYNPENHKFSKLPVKTDVVTQVSFARNGTSLAYCGSNISYPPTAWFYPLHSGTQKEIADPEKTFFAHVKFGKTEDWDFKNKKGYTIQGRIYYPPDYNPKKKYPVLVYYYGGTVPTTRDFGGRYPKNLFAAMGYIVYDLQPSGAIGYGQDFSALHVNGWGKENASDIIEGTEKFLDAHPQADRRAVACMGASYGGYMTMWLTTQTQLFTTAIAHAGISDITSYWGQGYWGYLYSATASANSFPWNNKKLYVEHSPLFNADKIHTPLLLLHGTSDTNVPTGESIQLYTALKLLGRTVELVEIKGQDHHIIDYNKRILWQKTIFAWLAKYLKHQPEWWNQLYPKKDL